MRRKITLTICMITLFGVLAFSHAAVKFSDVKINDWFSSSVIKLTDIGGIAGYPDGTFRPSGTITRAEFTSIVARSLGIKEKEISGDSWSAGIMAAAIDAGLVRSGEFPDVNTPVTRYEMARMTVRALEYRKETLPSDYKDYSSLIKDLNKSEAFKDDIMKVVATGIIAGYPDKTFQGLKTLSRAEASIVVVKILDKSARNIPVKPSAVGQIALGETKPVTEIISNVTDLNKFNPNLKTVTLVTAESIGLKAESVGGVVDIVAPGRTGVITAIKDRKTVTAFSGAYVPGDNYTFYTTTRFPIDYKTIDYFGFFRGSTDTGIDLIVNPWKE